jgi:uncharacterized protein YutD
MADIVSFNIKDTHCVFLESIIDINNEIYQVIEEVQENYDNSILIKKISDVKHVDLQIV